MALSSKPFELKHYRGSSGCNENLIGPHWTRIMQRTGVLAIPNSRCRSFPIDKLLGQSFRQKMDESRLIKQTS